MTGLSDWKVHTVLKKKIKSFDIIQSYYSTLGMEDNTLIIAIF